MLIFNGTSMGYNIGMKVVFLHQKGGGIVESILENGRVSILDEDGFSHPYPTSQIAPVYNEVYPIDEKEIERKTESNKVSKNNHQIRTSIIEERIIGVPEIDLHIEELTDSHKGLSNHEILSQQMLAFRQFFNKSKSQKTKKIVVIHGVGEGVLRYEIRSFLNKENGLEFYDADYLKYGQGATVIEMWGH